MVTKRTRLTSGLVAILMLVSMFTAFVLPVTAETASVPVGTSAATGLANAGSLPNIKDYSANVNAYQVSDLDGMKTLMDLVYSGNALSGVTIYQSADIDMEGFPFAGIGSIAKPFSGVFDGNGFVIKNLYVIRNDETALGAGLFGGISGATIKNVGVASGVVVGNNVTGGVVGGAVANTTNTIVNCWNAATVVGGGTNGTGGVVGRLYAGNQTVQNCYNVGLVFNNQNRAAGVVGWVEASDTINVSNCYNAGEIVLGFYGDYDDAAKYSAVLSGDTTGAIGSSTANNYYVAGRGTAGSMKELGAALNDAGSKVEKSELATLAVKLNNGLTSDIAGWELSFKDSTAGYPTLAYTKNATDEGEAVVVIQHVADAEAVNVNGAQDWAQGSPLFATLVSKKNGAFSSTTMLSDVQLRNANDLFVLGMVTINTVYKTVFGNGNVYLAGDVDLDTQSLFKGIEYYVPICSGTGYFNGVFYGQNHVIYNWHSYSYAADGHPSGGLFPKVNATITDLGMVDASSTYIDLHAASANTYGALMVERVRNAADAKVVISNCFTTGTLNIGPGMANPNNYGGLLSTTWYSTSKISNCWADVDVDDGSVTTTKARAIGKLPDTFTSAISNCYYLADEEPYISKGEKNVTLNGKNYAVGVDNGVWYHLRDSRLPESHYSTDDGSLAIFLNQNNIQSVTVKNGKTVFKNSGDEMYKVTLKLMVDDENGYVYDERYYAFGETVNILGEIENGESVYSYNYGKTSLQMPAEDLVVEYYKQGDSFDSALAEKIKALYGNGEFDFKLFENGADMEVAYEAAVAALDANDNAAAIENLAKAVTSANLVGEPVLRMEEGYYPPYSKKDVYDKLNKLNPSNDWGISTREDWEAIAKEKNEDKNVTFDNYTFHFNNDVDMGGAAGKTTTPINPAKNGNFSGYIYGHGHKITNLNINWDVSEGPWVGLVGYGNRVIIRDLTIESGSVTATGGNSDEQMIAAFIGGGEDCFVYNCVNKADVDASKVTTVGTNGQSVSGIAGLTNASIIDSCINTGNVKAANAGYAYGISGKADASTLVVNSYTSGTLAGKETGLARYSSNADKEGLYQNSYIVDGEFCTLWEFDDEDEFELSSDELTDSELAGLLNRNFVNLAWRENALNGNNTPTYFTVNENDETVICDSENPDRTVSVAMECEGHETKYLYGEKGDVVTPNYSRNATYKQKTDSGYDPATNQLTLGTSDVVLAVYTNDPLTDQLEAAMATFEGAGLEAYKTEGVEDFAAFFAEVKQKLANGAYTTQEEIDADTAKINSAVTKDGVNYPRPSWSNYTSTNLMITSLADLEKLYTMRTNVTAKQTIHFVNNIEVTEGSVANSMNGLNASIDGHGHTIKGVKFSGIFPGSENNKTPSMTPNSWLGQYTGSSIKNLVLDSWEATDLPWQSALLVGSYQGTDLTIENVTVIKSSVVSSDMQNGAGLLVGVLEALYVNTSKITFKNIEINGNELDVKAKYNAGFLIGRAQNGTIVADGIYVTDNTMKGTATSANSYKAFLIGLCTAQNVTLTNITVSNNKVAEGSASVLVGHLKTETDKNSKGAATLTVSNIVATGNGSYPLIVAGDSSARTIDESTIFTDATVIVKGTPAVSNDATKDDSDLKSGLAAATMNTTYGAEVWTVKDGKTVQLAFNEDAAPMTKVTLQPAKVNYTIMEESNYTGILYADSDGKIIILESVKNELNKRGIWDWDAIEKDTYGPNNNVVYGTPIPYHEHVYDYDTTIKGEHTATCTWEYGNNKCPWSVTEECDYTQSFTCDDPNAEPGNATHTGTCVCGQEGTSVKCNPTAITTLEPTCETEGKMIYVCTDCSYYHEETIVKREHDLTDFAADKDEDGSFAGTHTKTCKYEDCNSSVTEKCVFEGKTEVIPATNDTPGEKRTYCTECDAYVVTEVIPALAHLEAETELGYLGEKMEVLVKIKNNPGIIGATLKITYDSTVVTLNKAELALDESYQYKDKWAIPTGSYSFGTEDTEDDKKVATVALAGYDPNGNYKGESLLKLTFKVADKATVGTYDLGIKVSQAKSYNATEDEYPDVSIAEWTGSYDVVDIMLGDVDRDRSVTIADAILMAKELNKQLGEDVFFDKAAADVDKNGTFNSSDLIQVLKYLNREIEEFKRI